MTSYITITDAETDPSAPLTSELAKKWRDNPIAIAEKDASVPAGLRLGVWFLGSIATTSGTSQTLSGLNLAPYRLLAFTINSVSSSNTGADLFLNAQKIGDLTDTTIAQFCVGGGYIELFSGAFWSTTAVNSTIPPTSAAGLSGVTTASTSITFTSNGNFDAGSIRIYGII